MILYLLVQLLMYLSCRVTLCTLIYFEFNKQTEREKRNTHTATINNRIPLINAPLTKSAILYLFIYITLLYPFFYYSPLLLFYAFHLPGFCERIHIMILCKYSTILWMINKFHNGRTNIQRIVPYCIVYDHN